VKKIPALITHGDEAIKEDKMRASVSRSQPLSSEEKPPSPAGDNPQENPAAPPEPREDFASMLEESFQAQPSQTQTFEIGQSVEGPIVAMGHDAAFVDIGGKGEATISLEELRDDDGTVKAKVGDRVKALIVSVGTNLEISRKLAQGAAGREQLAAAHKAGLPVDGRVEKVNKGGYEVRISGQRGFCPMSQIGTDRSVEPEEHLNKTYAFRILEIKDGGKDVVVSRRAILEEEAREIAREVMKKVIPGAILPGRIASVTGFGAFVDLGGGVHGLLHVSEMGWTRVSTPSEMVQPGQELTVQILGVDDEGQKIALSLKQLQADPWLKLAGAYRPGQTIQGRVTRLADFGAFVELEPGIEALAHVSTFPPTRGDWKDAVPPGTTTHFRIENIDVEKRRIGIALTDAPAGTEGKPVSNTTQTPQESEGLGSLADKLRAAMSPKKRNG
jgi:small subunit ribosomal protein S1